MGNEEGRKSDWRMLTEKEKGSTDCGDLEPRQIFDFETEGIQNLGEDIKREEELKTGKGNKIRGFLVFALIPLLRTLIFFLNQVEKHWGNQ